MLLGGLVPREDRVDVVATGVGHLEVLGDREPVVLGGGDRGEHLALGGVDVGDSVLGDFGGLAHDSVLITGDHTVSGRSVQRHVLRAAFPGGSAGRRDVLPVPVEHIVRLVCGGAPPCRSVGEVGRGEVFDRRTRAEPGGGSSAHTLTVVMAPAPSPSVVSYRAPLVVRSPAWPLIRSAWRRRSDASAASIAGDAHVGRRPAIAGQRRRGSFAIGGRDTQTVSAHVQLVCHANPQLDFPPDLRLPLGRYRGRWRCSRRGRSSWRQLVATPDFAA